MVSVFKPDSWRCKTSSTKPGSSKSIYLFSSIFPFFFLLVLLSRPHILTTVKKSSAFAKLTFVPIVE